ncbi:alpha/beta hydrolase [Streptomyces sp. NPDC087440]|uniref:alpha/beta hydrolase n=1 Tax=Streptomyces sp. NPDC087440 TaxID=3365790 RepID=UPI003817FC56
MSLLRSSVLRASCVSLAVAACLSTVPPLASAADSPADEVSGAPLGRFYEQRPAWSSCAGNSQDTTGRAMDSAGLQCADLTVPLDYSAPQGRTITVAVSRLKAADTRRRIGTLLINIGGPGGPALAVPPVIRQAMKDVGPRYDIVGFDPRFVGRSTPLDCRWPVGSAWFSAGADRAGFDRQVSLQKRLSAQCRSAGASALPYTPGTPPPSVLPYITTRNTARDMDVIRAALGERKISYLGYSYGTYLGTVYTQMFPGRFDRVVLDGAFAPDDYGPRMLKGSEAENEQALADWAAWAAERHTTYRLGRTRDDVLAAVDRIVAASARKPLEIGTGTDAFRLDDTQVPALLFTATADDTDPARASFSEQMSVLARAAEGAAPTALPAEFAASLRYLLYGGSEPSGVQHAVLCGDVGAPRDPRSYWLEIQGSRAAHPLFGPMTHNIGPCAFWDRPRERPTRVRHDAPALIVAATGDPRTTYRSSVALHDLLPSSRLVTLRGANRHGLFGRYGSTCVDDEVNRYLATGRLPVQDPTCVKERRTP